MARCFTKSIKSSLFMLNSQVLKKNVKSIKIFSYIEIN